MICADVSARAARGRAGPLALGLGLAIGCACGDEDATGRATAGTGGAGGSGGSGGASGSAGESGTGAVDAGCPPQQRPPEVPEGWVPYPGLPCECDLWMAPSEHLMSPAPGWLERRPGLLEMDVYWAVDGMRFVGGRNHGDSWGGRRLLALYRELPGVSWKKYDDILIFDVGARRPLFQVIQPLSHRSKCGAYVEDLHQGRAMAKLHVASTTLALPVDRSLVAGRVEVPGAALPLVHRSHGTRVPEHVHVSATHAMWTLNFSEFSIYSFATATLEEQAFRVVTHVEDAALHDGLALFTGTVTAESRAYVVGWSEAYPSGHRVAPANDADEAASPGMDGEWIVWTEARGWDGAKWADVALYKAPFTEDPRAIAGERVRGLPFETALDGYSWKVGGGYAANMFYRGDPHANDRLVILVRLSDGVSWLVEAEAYRNLSVRYVDGEELAMEESVEYPNPEGLNSYYSWTILRQSIAALGPGQPP